MAIEKEMCLELILLSSVNKALGRSMDINEAGHAKSVSDKHFVVNEMDKLVCSYAEVWNKFNKLLSH